ncbi:MAG: hypothetical protein KJ666_02790 [Bacteroidetes bacterium]|nr:hypothetical protein [Bacteroidota bacterium]MBU2585157.1 hypothetical protein [Bacteroidota bacterium]
MKKIKSNLKILVPIISVFVLGACLDIPDEFVAPTWDLEVNVPILNRTETVKELIKNEKNIYIDSSTADLLVKYDSVKTESKALVDIFKDNIKFEDDFVVKPKNVDTLTFETFVKDDSVSLDEARFSGGKLEYKLSNYLNRSVSINVLIPGFTKVTPSGVDTLKFDISAAANTSSNKSIDVNGYVYKHLASNPLGTPGSGFYVKGFAKIGAGYSGDSVVVNFKLEKLAFSYLKGKIKPYKTEIKEKRSKLTDNQDVKDILPKVSVYGAKLTFKSNSTLQNVEVGLRNFQVVGIFKTGEPNKLLKIRGKTVLDTNISLSDPVINVNIDDFAINEFLSPKVPDSISYKGDIIVNPNYKTLEASLPDSIKYEIGFNIFSIFKINYAVKTDTLKDAIDIKEKDKKHLDKAKEVELTLELNNGFPVGFSLNGYFVDSLYNYLFHVTRQEGAGSASDTTLQITAANVDAEGKVSSSVSQSRKIKLVSEDFQKLKRAKHLILTANAHTTGGQKVYLRANDKVQIRVYGKVKVLVDFSDKD